MHGLNAERKGQVAVRIFKAFSQKDEECRLICRFNPEQRPEDHLEAVWVSDAGGADESYFCGHALRDGAIPEGRALYDG